jgi:endonuclease YncB( thermonuclease family)
MKAWSQFLFPFLILLILSAPAFSQDKFYRVERVIDGDTLLLTHRERVRLINVDTREAK